MESLLQGGSRLWSTPVQLDRNIPGFVLNLSINFSCCSVLIFMAASSVEEEAREISHATVC